MTEEQTPVEETLPEAVVSKKKGLSLIWIVPLVAFCIGVGLVYTALTEKGPQVTITFASADGLEAGKTKVKYKDVTIGKVESVELNDDFSEVIATVRLTREADEFLSENTRFWIVRPRMHGATVSGLETLLSGAYVAVDPGVKGEEQYEFIGLESPPLVTGNAKGKLFTLKAKELGSLDYGSPVYYRDISVGQVVGYGLQKGGKGVDIQVFVDAPYDTYVTDTSRFWVASGLDMELDAEGIRVDTESIVSILVGGVAFTNPDYLGTAPVADAGDIFRLYDTRKLAMTEEFIEKEYFVLKFSQAVRGLDVGAPVEFKGFPIGRVVDIGIEFDWKSKEVLVPVRIEVEQERIERIVSGSTAPAPEESEKMLDVLVQQGLRGQVLPANLLTGKLYVSLDFFAQAEPALVGVTKDGLQEIPTIPTPIEELTKNLSALLEKLQKLPVEEIGQNTLDAIKSIKATGDKLEKVAGSEDLKIALTATRQAMENANALVQDDSATVVELQRALRDLSDAAKSIRSLADQLERHPESLLQGKRRN